MADTTATIWDCFSGLRDPRASRREKKHRLLDIVAIALCAVTAGAGDWPEVVAFAQARQDWLKTFLALPNGVPSRSTFERVFAALSPAGLQRCLLRWLHGCGRALGIGHVAAPVQRPRDRQRQRRKRKASGPQQVGRLGGLEAAGHGQCLEFAHAG